MNICGMKNRIAKKESKTVKEHATNNMLAINVFISPKAIRIKLNLRFFKAINFMWLAWLTKLIGK